jgi:hypothetical protein
VFRTESACGGTIEKPTKTRRGSFGGRYASRHNAILRETAVVEHRKQTLCHQGLRLDIRRDLPNGCRAPKLNAHTTLIMTTDCSRVDGNRTMQRGTLCDRRARPPSGPAHDRRQSLRTAAVRAITGAFAVRPASYLRSTKAGGSAPAGQNSGSSKGRAGNNSRNWRFVLASPRRMPRNWSCRFNFRLVPNSSARMIGMSNCIVAGRNKLCAVPARENVQFGNCVELVPAANPHAPACDSRSFGSDPSNPKLFGLNLNLGVQFRSLLGSEQQHVADDFAAADLVISQIAANCVGS